MIPRAGLPRLAAVALSLAILTGCGFKGAASIPLPGGQGTGGDAYSLTVEFPDVLDLVPQSAVKVDDVAVGSVESISLSGYTARVVVRVNGSVQLPENSRASLRQTSLLGEKFVSLDRPPPDQAKGTLRGGETIGLDRTTRSVEIEEVLSALSLLLNGGSLEQLQTINVELGKALQGREGDIKDLLGQLNTFVGGLDAQKGQIIRALDSLDRLTARLVDQRTTIATALQDIPPGVAVLVQEREQITKVLISLSQLSDVAVRVIQNTQQNTKADLEALRPILTQLNAAGTDLPNALELLTNYPFPKTVDQGIQGSYANLFATLNIDVTKVPGLLGLPPLPLAGAAAPQSQPAPQSQTAVPPKPPAPTGPQLTVPIVPTVPTVPIPPLNTVVPAPNSGGVSGFLDRLKPNGSSGGGGLLGLLIGGLR